MGGHLGKSRGSSPARLLTKQDGDSQQFLSAFLFLEQVGAVESDSGVGIVVGAEVCDGAGVKVCDGAGVKVCEGARAEVGIGVIN